MKPPSNFPELEDAINKARAEEIRIPFGVGIAGSVAQSKQPINIRDAYADPRFNADIDLRTGYRTRLVLCLPICNYEGDVIGVAQIINKTNGMTYFRTFLYVVFMEGLECLWRVNGSLGREALCSTSNMHVIRVCEFPTDVGRAFPQNFHRKFVGFLNIFFGFFGMQWSICPALKRDLYPVQIFD